MTFTRFTHAVLLISSIMGLLPYPYAQSTIPYYDYTHMPNPQYHSNHTMTTHMPSPQYHIPGFFFHICGAAKLAT
jgi:hypothetical protein